MEVAEEERKAGREGTVNAATGDGSAAASITDMRVVLFNFILLVTSARRGSRCVKIKER